MSTQTMTRTGWVLTGLYALFMLGASVTPKLMQMPVAEETMAQLGWPAGYALTIGLIELALVILYLIPRTSVLGAVLTMALLGGAMATQIRAGSPLFSHILFSVYLGLFMWGGLWLRSPRLRAIFPLTGRQRPPNDRHMGPEGLDWRQRDRRGGKDMRLFLLTGLLLLPASTLAQSAEPRQLPDQFVAAWNAHDIGAFEKLYTADAIWVPSAEERTEGPAAILGEFAKVHQGGGWAVARKVTLVIKDEPKVQMLRPDVAIILFRMDFLADGKLAPDQKRTLILVADKSHDGWRIAAGQLTK